MDQWLNKKTGIAVACLFLSFLSFSQVVEDPKEARSEEKDYKDKDQFYKFHKRTQVISAWQINELKSGALVVRLKTNKTLIDALQAAGNTQTANEKIAETYIINKNTMMAYINNFTFCKLYFIYSNNSDTLLKGMRSGIFLDTNLAVSPAIEMRENFYLIAERDYAYNSSIGFVKEDSALLVREGGNPVREMGAVIKNKYGHQLKEPFPYYVKDKTFADYDLPFYVVPAYKGASFYWVQAEGSTFQQTLKKEHPDAGEGMTVKIRKQYTYKSIATVVEQLSENLGGYLQRSPRPDINKMGPMVKPYLY